MTVQMDEFTWSLSYMYAEDQICHSISLRFLSTPVKLKLKSFMFFLVKRNFNKLNVPLKRSSLAWWQEGETIEQFQTLQTPLDHQKLNQMMTTAVVVCGYENRPRRIFEKKGHRREQIIKIC